MVALLFRRLEWDNLCGQFDPKCQNVVITPDASGRWGCGAYKEEDSFIQYKWQEDIVEANITVKELPIVMAGALWGRE